jgi:hypothetical protein
VKRNVLPVIILLVVANVGHADEQKAKEPMPVPLFDLKTLAFDSSFFETFNRIKYLEETQATDQAKQLSKEMTRKVYLVTTQPSPEHYRVSRVELIHDHIWPGGEKYVITFHAWLPPDTRFDAHVIMGGTLTSTERMSYERQHIAENTKVSIVDKKKKKRLPDHPDWKCSAVQVTYCWGR